MRYLLALVCPPAAIGLCGGRWRAVVAVGLCLLGIASIRWGVGIVLLFGCILWAMHDVGDSRAAAKSARFIRTVKPIRFYRG